MQHATTGVYFDGKSSLPQDAKIFFDEQRQVLLIHNGYYHRFEWQLSDIELSKNGNQLTFIRKDHPAESLIIEDNQFAQHIYPYKNTGWYQKLLDQSKAFYVALAALFISFLAVSYFWIIPWLGEKSIELIPETYDQELGEIAYQNTIDEEDIDPEKTKILNNFAKELKFVHPKPLRFTVVKSDEVNAFALPNGDIVIFTGIIDKMKSYEELVALIGHEATHIHHRHSMKMMGRNLSGLIFISTILGDANGVISVIGQNAHELRNLSYSRHYEEEADTGGFNTMKINKINPKGMVDLFKVLDAKEESIEIPEFISTHPITKNRIQNAENLIQKQPYAHQENARLKQIFDKLKP